MGKSGRVCLPSSLPSQSSGVNASGSGLSQDDPGRPRVAQHALVLGSGQSSQIPFSLPLEKDLLTQPFNGLIHRNLSPLYLHAWLLEPHPSRSKDFLMKWQQELKLLREAQPERFINQSGPFLLSDVSQTWWMSGRPL